MNINNPEVMDRIKRINNKCNIIKQPIIEIIVTIIPPQLY